MPAPRSQWRGFLKLSLVSCPIALYPAITDANRMKFRQVNKRTGNRLRQQLVDTVTGETVEAYDKGRGYEIGSEQFLPVEASEIETARAVAAAPPVPVSPPAPVAADERRLLARGRGTAPDPEAEDDREGEAPPAPPRLENDHTIDIEPFV